MTRPVYPKHVEVALRDAIERACPWLASAATATVSLADTLYAEWYTKLRTPKPLELPTDAPSFVAMLRASHAAAFRWERGWRAERVSTAGRVVGLREGEQRLLDLVDCVSEERPGLLPRPGTPICARARRDSLDFLPDFWVTHSDAWVRASDTQLRLYWNVTPAGAPALVRTITEGLGPDLRYSLKMPSTPELFARSDAAVLYLDASAFDAARDTLRHAHAAVAHHLVPDVPRLTYTLAPGLGIAEDAGQANESFGTHRCRLVAEALSAADPKDRARPHKLLALIGRRFADAGLSISAPHLRDRGRRDYIL